MKILTAALTAAVLAALISSTPPGAGGSCEDLSRLALPGTAITLATKVEAGAFALPGQTPPAMVRSLPAFCRVAATLKPTADSDIKMEVWLPLSGWNGKFMAVGNGAFSGAIGYSAAGSKPRSRVRGQFHRYGS